MIKMEVILPKRKILDADKIGKAIENALNGVALDVQSDFRVTTQTWQHNHPDFNIKSKIGIRIISTDDRIYRFVNDGTRVRRALMTPDFRPKTRNRYIGSNKGQGGVIVISRKIARPGIKAREFNIAIREKWDKGLPRILQRAIDAEFR